MLHSELGFEPSNPHVHNSSISRKGSTSSISDLKLSPQHPTSTSLGRRKMFRLDSSSSATEACVWWRSARGTDFALVGRGDGSLCFLNLSTGKQSVVRGRRITIASIAICPLLHGGSVAFVRSLDGGYHLVPLEQPEIDESAMTALSNPQMEWVVEHFRAHRFRPVQERMRRYFVAFALFSPSLLFFLFFFFLFFFFTCVWMFV